MAGKTILVNPLHLVGCKNKIIRQSGLLEVEVRPGVLQSSVRQTCLEECKRLTKALAAEARVL